MLISATPIADLRMAMRVAATCDGRLLVERVGGELGRLGVDVDRRAVGALGAGRADRPAW